MMIFMGIMFFKVASGSAYFIASSIWGIADAAVAQDGPLRPGANGV
jgi:hypothetical protein